MKKPIAAAASGIRATRDWAAYNKAQMFEKKEFLELLRDLCEYVPDLPRIPGAGRARLPIKEMVFACILQTYLGLSGRRFQSDVAELQKAGYLSRLPHFNSLSRYLGFPEMTAILRELLTVSCSPMRELETDFASDSSGFSKGQFFHWMTAKWGKVKPRRRGLWLKCHATCGIFTHIVTSVHITRSNVHDTNLFPAMIEDTARNFEIHRVMADKAYLSEKHLRLVRDKGGVAFIPFKPNNRLDAGRKNSEWQSLYHLFHLHRDKFQSIYRHRVAVEQVFSMVKRKFGERCRAKTETAQINEILCKFICHNICCVIWANHRISLPTEFKSRRVASR